MFVMIPTVISPVVLSYDRTIPSNLLFTSVELTTTTLLPGI